MEALSQVDVKQLGQDPDFKNLTVEQAIRLMGEREKALINQERDKIVSDLKAKLNEKTIAMKASR